MVMALKQNKKLQFKVLLEQDEDGLYVASAPELPGCHTQGKTLKEVRTRIKEAIELVLEAEQRIETKTKKTITSYPRFLGIENIAIPLYA
ncbi:MAG: hypothetical protein UV05_C0033G0008 [candidate division CPR1 bacterium GW2011_GWA2_42_17]|uniref:HicB-like antitoxin of toxin-antitoxin system domain-containing protein n=1 Tax=candidate division CPR1 bacterium GW2011_GWA2_42_17 TaxID=1618341 RepID=A0A0G1B9W1_9BACT|nr:MAG: hypothetical protein UV05_C0033G0008 [candidate division CPR1 bacterium GW2011_GWA2_42_17]